MSAKFRRRVSNGFWEKVHSIGKLLSPSAPISCTTRGIPVPHRWLISPHSQVSILRDFHAYLHFSDAPVVVSHNELSFRVSFRYTINLSFLFFTLSNFLATPTSMNFFSCLKKQVCILCQRNSCLMFSNM